MLAVCAPAPVTRSSGSVSGTCFAGSHSPWSPPFAPPTPRRIAPLCSPASQLLWRSPTSRVRASSATAPHLPDAGRQRRRRSGQIRDLPASDAIPLHATKRALPLTWAGLSPVGSHQLAAGALIQSPRRRGRAERYPQIFGWQHDPRAYLFSYTLDRTSPLPRSSQEARIAGQRQLVQSPPIP